MLKKVVIFCIFSALIIAGCSKPQEQLNAENTAVQWVHSEADDLLKSYPSNLTEMISNVSYVFYVLDSSKVGEGFCVEIASKERNPPKYPNPDIISTIPLFVEKEGTLDLKNAQCFRKAYPDRRGLTALAMQEKLSESEYSAAKFFLMREVGNAIFKIRLKQLGYKPAYEENYFLEMTIDASINATFGEKIQPVYKAYAISLIGTVGAKQFIEETVNLTK